MIIQPQQFHLNFFISFINKNFMIVKFKYFVKCIIYYKSCFSYKLVNGRNNKQQTCKFTIAMLYHTYRYHT